MEFNKVPCSKGMLTKTTIDAKAHVDALIDRALALLSFMGPAEAAEHLCKEGAGGEGYLAVAAAEILLKDKET